MRLGVTFMSWSNFCVLVRLSLPWRDFITLSDIIRICGHAMYGVITLWWSRESWYDFFLRLGWNFRLGGILFVLVSFYTLVQSTESWYDFPSFGYNFRFSEILFLLVSLDILVWLTASWYDFLHFARLFRFSVILFGLVKFHILVRSTASWCDPCVLDINIFCALVFLFLHVDFHFYSCIYNVLHMDRISCCNVKKSWVINVIFLV